MTESTPAPAREGLLWAPSPEYIARTNLTRYLGWLVLQTQLKSKHGVEVFHHGVAVGKGAG